MTDKLNQKSIGALKEFLNENREDLIAIMLDSVAKAQQANRPAYPSSPAK